MASKFITCFYKISIIICYIFIQRSVKYFLLYTFITLYWYYFQLAHTFFTLRMYKFAAILVQEIHSTGILYIYKQCPVGGRNKRKITLTAVTFTG